MQSLHYEVVDVACHCGSGQPFRDCHGSKNPEARFFGPASDRLIRHCLAHSLPANQVPLYTIEPFVSQLAAVRGMTEGMAEIANQLIDQGMDELGHAHFGDGPVWPQLPASFIVLAGIDLQVEGDDGLLRIPQGAYMAKVKGWDGDTGEVRSLQLQGDDGEDCMIDQGALFHFIRANTMFVDTVYLGLKPVLAFRPG
jgi:hypothetical protein